MTSVQVTLHRARPGRPSLEVTDEGRVPDRSQLLKAKLKPSVDLVVRPRIGWGHVSNLALGWRAHALSN